MSGNYWSVVVLAGLAGWIAAALAFIFTAFPAKDTFRPGPAKLWGSVLAVSYAIWILGMLRA